MPNIRPHEYVLWIREEAEAARQALNRHDEDGVEVCLAAIIEWTDELLEDRVEEEPEEIAEEPPEGDGGDKRLVT